MSLLFSPSLGSGRSSFLPLSTPACPDPSTLLLNLPPVTKVITVSEWANRFPFAKHLLERVTASVTGGQPYHNAPPASARMAAWRDLSVSTALAGVWTWQIRPSLPPGALTHSGRIQILGSGDEREQTEFCLLEVECQYVAVSPGAAHRLTVSSSQELSAVMLLST